MTIYVTRPDNSSPVAVKPGGSAQGRIGANVEINVIDIQKGYARFNNPIVIPDKENWIRMDFISEPEPSPTPDPEPSPNEIIIRIDLDTRKVYVNDQSFPI